jgi:sulfur carrier protein ThiS
LKSRVLNRAGNFHPYLLLFLNDQKLPRSGFETLPLSEGDRLEIVALAEGG